MNLIWVVNYTLHERLDSATWLFPVRDLRNAGWQVLLIAAGPKDINKVRGVDVQLIPRVEIYFLRQVIFHLRALAAVAKMVHSTDVIIYAKESAPWFFLLQFITRTIFRMHRPLFAMDTRTLTMEPEDRLTWKDRLRGAYDLLMSNLANRWADGRLAITERIAVALNIPKEKLWGIWPSGVELHQFQTAYTERRWPSAGEPIHLIYIGSMHYERNLMILSKAVVKANEEGAIFKLTLIGDGRERADLEHFAAATSGQVKVISPIPPEEIPGWLARAHVGVLPFPDELKFQVSSPIKLFEYMAAGMPILASRIVCHTDIVGNNHYAFWSDGSDINGLLAALREIWSSSQDKLQEMGLQALKDAPKWSWSESAHKLKTALQKGVGNG